MKALRRSVVGGHILLEMSAGEWEALQVDWVLSALPYDIPHMDTWLNLEVRRLGDVVYVSGLVGDVSAPYRDEWPLPSAF